MSAEWDLPFYFGSGTRTRAGSAGMLSTFGQMLDRAAGSRLSKAARREARELTDESRERLKRWMAPLQTDTTPNVSALEDALLRNISTGGENDAQRIESKLAALTSVQVRALHLHYTGKRLFLIVANVSYDIDPCAVLVVSARRLCGTAVEPFLSELRRAFIDAQPAQREQLVEDAEALFTASVRAYNEATEVKVRSVQVDEPREWKR